MSSPEPEIGTENTEREGPPEGPGELETSVRLELSQMSYVARDVAAVGAILLARTLDKYASNMDGAAALAAVTKGLDSLRVSMNQLRRLNEERGGRDEAGAHAAELSTPVRDSSDV